MKLTIIAMALLLTGCFTPMPDNQIAPYIFWEKPNASDNYVTRYCDNRV